MTSGLRNRSALRVLEEKVTDPADDRIGWDEGHPRRNHAHTRFCRALRGRQNVGAYWEKALRLSPDLHFEKLGVFIGIRSLAIHFRNRRGRLSVETFEIGDRGLVSRAAAHHG